MMGDHHRWVRAHVILLVSNLLSFAMTVAVVSLMWENSRDNSIVHRRTQEAVCCLCQHLETTGKMSLTCPLDEKSVHFSFNGLLDFEISEDGRLCTLVQLAPDGANFKPVARSYDALDWEPMAGDFAGVTFACSGTFCEVDLPSLPSGALYQLTSFGIPPQYSGGADTIARFLEQATFGPTRNTIAYFNGDASTLAFAKWIKDQQVVIPLTSHRAFFRKHLNARIPVATPQGPVTHPCQLGARYRRYTFTRKDETSSVLVESIVGTTKKALLIDGFVRTIVDGPIHHWNNARITFEDGIYQINSSNRESEALGGRIRLKHPTRGFIPVSFNGSFGNPPLTFDFGIEPNVLLTIPDSGASPFDSVYYEIEEAFAQEIILTKDVTGSTCATLEEPGNPLNPVYAFYNGQYWAHDPRFETIDNTLENPAIDGGGTAVRETTNIVNPEHAAVCSNVPRTFLNEEHCVLSSHPAACSIGHRFYESEVIDGDLPDFWLQLSPENIRAIYDVTSSIESKEARYFYVVEGLRMEDDKTIDLPCVPGSKSRWVKTACSGAAATINAQVHKIFQTILSRKQEANPYLRDVRENVDEDCPAPLFTLSAFEVEDTDGNCWLNVHPDHWNVYDFTTWTKTHPGNIPPQNPIKSFAEAGLTTLTFPGWHDMNRWQGNKGRFGLAGRLYDWIHYYELPVETRSYELSNYFGFTAEAIIYPVSKGVLVCGSPFEISNDLFLGGSQGHGAFDTFDVDFKTTSNDDFFRQKGIVWTNIVLNADDQLRQRVAWALSQILVITPDASATGERMTENHVTYYDILVRNAFGNYRQLLKEIAYSPMMAQMLTFFKSKSTAYTWERSGKVEFADENFAREVMQLFSTGLTMLHTNGTEKVDSAGESIRAYSNDDIMEYARVWTGFNPQPWRGNTEILRQNEVDPLLIDVYQRDPFPKMGLQRKYVGDHIPLCIDLPKKSFLTRGAIYRLLGSTASPELQTADPAEWKTAENVKRLTLQTTGKLFETLCGSKNPASCKFAAKVILNETISCSGGECNVDTLRSVEVTSGIFYEYIRPPCVYQAFFNDARTVVRRRSWSQLTCGDPRTVVASTACCSSGVRKWVDEYWGESVTLATAQDRCLGQGLCSQRSHPTCNRNDPMIGSYCLNMMGYWSEDPCKVRVKIDIDGKVAIVHTPEDIGGKTVSNLVQDDTKTFFRVDWFGGDVLSLIENCLSVSSCSISVDEKCICDVTVVDEQVYADSASTSSNDVLKSLHIGAFDPILLGMSSPSGSSGNVVWYNPSGKMDMHTIFEIIHENGTRHWRKNMNSTVSIDGTTLSFRNPVHFISLTEPQPRDAHFETDAAIDHYIHHSNTATFLAMRLAQRFGISNPSPRYVAAIATAFRSGSYVFDSISFGSGHYGDLAATLACVLLDREARTVLLDADPSHGSLREPIMKLIGLMRSMEFELYNEAPFVDFDTGITRKIGQMAHVLPNVFSFFLPEFKPSGPVAQAALNAPEAQVLTSPRIIDTLNGLSSIIKYGLSKCWGGFSVDYTFERPQCNAYKIAADYKNEGTLGKLKYQPSDIRSSETITDELATLLTAGRLSKESRDIIEKVVEDETDLYVKVIKAQQLMVFSPEFHITNVVRMSGDNRPDPPIQPTPSHPYKAVVYLLLEGGMDSFNMLAPHTCSGTNPSGETLLEQYYAERTSLAITSTERSRIIDATNQPCSQFVVHEDLEVVERLYKAGDLAFFANAGVINKPMDKGNYNKVTRTQLFAHNAMQEEAQRVDPFEDAPGTGVLGRMCDVLNSNGFSVKPITIEDSSIATIGVPGAAVDPLFVSPGNINELNLKPISETFDPRAFLDQLNNATKLQSSLYGETWSKMLHTALHDNKALLDALSNTQLLTEFPTNKISENLQSISTLVASRGKRGVDRDVYFTKMGKWDHHSMMKENIAMNFKDLNGALSAFEAEMKAQDTWNDVTLVIASDFARTLTSNSGDGSDHAWGGHYFVMGGAVNGGRIHGEYPSDITSSGPLNVGRGRIMPTISWESILNSVLEWMGVPDSKLDYCLPNRHSTGSKLFTKNEVFE